tara:strand:- start:260 stop:973 length:714 start_codon:yes stop_codon:yes gene_type:complete
MYFRGQVHSPHALLEIADRRYEGITPANIFGFNRTIGSTYETIWNNGGLYSYPSSAAQLSVVSSNAADTMSVLINGLDADYNIIYDIVTLNGVTSVTTTNSFLRVNSAVILSGSNVGNISITNGADVVGYIEAGIGTTQACVYTVPAGHTLFLFRISLTSGTVNSNKYITYRNRIDSSNGRVLRVAEATFQINQQNFDRQVPFRIEEKTDFQFEAKSSSGENEVSIFVEALQMYNEA